MSPAYSSLHGMKPTNTGVEDKHSHIGLDCFSNLDHLLEELTLLLMPAGRIYNDNFKALLLELRHTLRGDGDWVRLSVRAEVCDLGLRSGLSRLIKGTSTERVRADDTRFKTTLLVVYRELRACRCFTITLRRRRHEASKANE